MPKNDYAVPEDANPLLSGDIPHPVRPLVEHPGAFLPYRGAQYHGVDPGHAPADTHDELWDQGRVPVEEEAPPEREVVPVPVRVVNESAKEARAFFTDQIGVGTTSDYLVGKNTDRTSLMIKNLDNANTVYISQVRSSAAGGYPIMPGEELSLSTSEAVYAVCPNGTALVAILGEMTLPL